jgi:uncharacterized protein YceK
MTENAALAIAVASIAGCTAVSNYGSSKQKEAEYPGTACVRAAWNHADRIECVKAQIITLKPEEKK